MTVCHICNSCEGVKNALGKSFKICEKCHSKEYINQSQVAESLGLNLGCVNKYVRLQDFTIVPQHDEILGANRKIWLKSTIDAFKIPLECLDAAHLEKLSNTGMKREAMGDLLGIPRVYVDSYCRKNNIYSIAVGNERKFKEENDDSFDKAFELFNQCMH